MHKQNSRRRQSGGKLDSKNPGKTHPKAKGKKKEKRKRENKAGNLMGGGRSPGGQIGGVGVVAVGTGVEDGGKGVEEVGREREIAGEEGEGGEEGSGVAGEVGAVEGGGHWGRPTREDNVSPLYSKKKKPNSKLRVGEGVGWQSKAKPRGGVVLASLPSSLSFLRLLLYSCLMTRLRFVVGRIRFSFFLFFSFFFPPPFLLSFSFSFSANHPLFYYSPSQVRLAMHLFVCFVRLFVC